MEVCALTERLADSAERSRYRVLSNEYYQVWPPESDQNEHQNVRKVFLRSSLNRNERKKTFCIPQNLRHFLVSEEFSP